MARRRAACRPVVGGTGRPPTKQRLAEIQSAPPVMELVPIQRRDSDHVLRHIQARLVPGVEAYVLDLTRAELGGENFELADLAGAFFWGANLEVARLNGANLGGAILTRANLCGADLESAFLYNTDLHGATYDRHTRWPEGFDPQQAGARLVE